MSLMTGATASDLPEAGAVGGVRAALAAYGSRLKGGDIGSLPAVLGLIVLVALFGILESQVFLSTLNFANLINQGAAIIVLAMGLIFVLLLGEIDLSAGFAAGTSAAVMAVLLNNLGLAWPLALLGAIATGVVIGLLLGLLVARLGIPSFVVTLAAFLALQGVMLWIIGEGGTIPIRNDALLVIMNGNMPVVLGWIQVGLVTVLFAAVTLRRIVKRRQLRLPSEAISVWLIKVLSLGVLLGLATFALNQERQRASAKIVIQGVPWVVPLIIVLLVVLTFVTTRTAFGRHIYAVGGNAEAARRAGISVSGVRIACFVLCSSLAALAGVLIASRDNSVSPTTGGAQTLLFAVGAAVIGGTSLFGGRGRIRDAIIGGLVIAVIANGLPLITEQAAVQFVVTGLVLLLAASVDAISRRKSAAVGR